MYWIVGPNVGRLHSDEGSGNSHPGWPHRGRATVEYLSTLNTMLENTLYNGLNDSNNKKIALVGNSNIYISKMYAVLN